jgi:paraquat-inducible protein A
LTSPDAPARTLTSALDRGLWRCDTCDQLASVSTSADIDGVWRCAACGSHLRARRTDAIARTWALLLAAAALYVPSNVLPVTRSASLLGTQEDTLLSGILFLWRDGSWALAAIVFLASIVVPVAKLVLLSFLLLSVQLRMRRAPLARLHIYRALETIGRWSMLDVFVITMLAALVQIQTFAHLQAGPGAVCFGAVVVLTMLATRTFDPRLIFDRYKDAAAPRERADE